MIDVADWVPEDEDEMPAMPPITEADVEAFVKRVAGFPEGKPADLPPWPFGVHCINRCKCHCGLMSCACHHANHHEKDSL